MQNLIYALIQVIHNFGAATVVGTAASALWLARDNTAAQHRLALLAAIGWAVQAASGASFGITTFYYDGHLPDIHGIAVAALLVKIACATLGFVLAMIYAKRGLEWTASKHLYFWRISLALGTAALTSAAFLRWYS